MGWKSVKEITRDEAISAIIDVINRKPYYGMTNNELEKLMCELSIGDDFDLPYYGHNFNITDDE